MKEISEEIKDFVVSQVEEKHSDNRIGVSELGFCVRKAWYKRKIPRKLDFKRALPIYIGKLFHEYIELGYPKTEVFVQHKLGKGRIVGKIDAIKEGNVIDFKSKKDLFWIEKKGASENDIKQIKFYAFASGIKKAKLIYYEVNPEIKPADNTEKFWWSLRKAIVKETRKRKPVSFDVDVKDVSDIVKDYEEKASILFESLNENKAPIPNAKEWECKYCEYKDVCEEGLYNNR